MLTQFYEEYTNKTPKKLKVIDAYLTYIFFTGVIQVNPIQDSTCTSRMKGTSI